MSFVMHISGFASHVPVACISNKALEAKVDTTDEWIVSRTGIKHRHMLADDENASDLGVAAAAKALHNCGLDVKDVTHVLVPTCTPDYLCPSQACLISHKLGMNGVMAFDINAACAGFLYGLEVGRGLLLANPKAVILLVCAEGLSRRMNWQDRSTCVLFGDGAAACVLTTEACAVSPEAGKATGTDTPVVNHPCTLADIVCTADGANPSCLHIGGGSRMKCAPGDSVGDDFFLGMQGREVFKYAVRSMTQISKETLERNHLAVTDIDLFIPHQANLRIIEAVGQRLGFENDRVFANVDAYGNTSAASIPIALAEALEQGRIKPGMKVLLATFGGTFTWGSALLRF